MEYKKIQKIKNILTKEEFLSFSADFDYNCNNLTDNENNKVDYVLGRLVMYSLDSLSENFITKINKVAQEYCSSDAAFSGFTAVEYNNKYGIPNLPPHCDEDFNDFIINFQLSSNIVWPIGLDLDLYKLDDNSAIIFNGNKNVHWRPHKNFNDGDFVRMIFFRFSKSNKTNSHMNVAPDPTYLKKVEQFRNNLNY